MNNKRSGIFEQGFGFVRNIYNGIESKVQSVNNNRIYRVLWCITVLACFILLFVLNHLTPLISDDFAYMFIYGENARISSLSDVVQSQVNHYYMWGGRSVVHFIAQVLLMMPAYAADIFNTLVYMGYIFLIYWHIKGNGKGSLSLFVLINLAVWFFQPVFGDTILWLTGSANYLWGTFFILLFLLPYRLYRGNNKRGVISVLVSAGLFFLGIVAGWTNENTAAGMILLTILFFFYYYWQGWKIPFWGIAGVAGSIIGFGVMILAPGNFERAGDASFLSLHTIAYRLFNCTLTAFYYSGPFILVCTIMLILYYRFPNGDKRSNLNLTFIYYLAAFAAVYAMLLSPTFPRRALFGVVTYLIVGTGILYKNLDFSYKFLRQISFSIIVLGFVSFLFTYYLAFREINVSRNIMAEREIEIERAKESGATSCEFKRYDGGGYSHGEDPYSEELMTRYYGIKITLKD